MKMNFTIQPPRSKFKYKKTTLTFDDYDTTMDKIILDETTKKEKFSMRFSMITRLYPLSNCSSCRK